VLAACVAFLVAGCGSSGGGGGSAQKDTSCDSGGKSLAAPLETGDVPAGDTPQVEEVKTPAGVSREVPADEEDTLVDLQNFRQGEPNHIDPALADTVQGAQIPVLLYDTLTDTDTDGKLVGKVAEKWDTNADGTEFTFTLKSGQTFSNGEPVTPTIFKRSWERALSPELKSTVNYHMLPIKGAQDVVDGKTKELAGVKADDAANTITITLDKPFADFPSVVQHPVFSPVPTEALDAKDPTQWEQGVMIGNGPYAQAAPWKHKEEIDLAKNDKYTAGPLANIPKIKFVISGDLDSAFSAFEAGKGDTAYIPPGKFSSSTAKYHSITDSFDGVYKFEIGQDDPCLGGPKNLKVREAISLAIDRDRINKQVYDDSRVVATGLTPPGVEGYKAGLCQYCTYDPAKAKKLVQEWKDAGGHLTGPIKIATNTGAGHEPVVSIMKENLKAIGLDADLEGLNPDTWTDDIRKAGGCHLCRSAWVWDYPIYDNLLGSQYLKSGIGSDNWARVDSPEFDKLIDDARATTDQAEREKKYQQAEKYLLDNVITVPLNWYRATVLTDNRVEGLKVNPLDFFSYDTATLS